MEKIITYENLRKFTYSNDKITASPIKGIIVAFHALGGCNMTYEDGRWDKVYAEMGLIRISPYTEPWCWMNKQAVDYTDEILDVLFKHYNLDENTPILVDGGSMGGLCALTYMCYAKRTPVACIANCPVCDLPYHYTERDDLPRTLYNAFWNYDGNLNDALKTASPIHLADKMPDSEYYLFHTSGDRSVNKQKHSDVFVQKMKDLGRNITYFEIEGRSHCDVGEDMFEKGRTLTTETLKKYYEKRVANK